MNRSRRQTRRPGWSVVACVVILITLTLGAGSAAQAGPAGGSATISALGPQVQAPVPRIAWKPCRAGSSLQCASVKVPLDYDQPTGPKISLRVEKRPADDQAHKIGSLFVNPGGPGGSAADFVPPAARLLGAPVRHRFDVIGVDPRGIGRSDSVHCIAKPQDPPLPPYPTEAFPRSDGQITKWLAFDAAVRQLCAKRANPILDHMSTADTVRDMDLIRQAVGDPMLSYYGISYGTMIGSTYAAMFPGRVRAIIVDGVLDPVQWTTGRFDLGKRYLVSARLGSGYGAWEALTSAFAECDRVGPKACPSAGRIGHEWNRVSTRLLAGSVVVHGERITYANTIANILYDQYEQRNYPTILRFIDRLYREIFQKTPQTAAALTEAWSQVQELARAADTGPPYGPPTDAGVGETIRAHISPTFQGVLCADSVNPDDPRAAIASARYADRQGPGFGALWSWLSSMCTDWPGSGADAFRGPWRANTANPILVTGNLHDPATPISGARAVNRLFGGSVLLTVNVWGHGALGESDCVVRKWDDYLVTGRLPAPGDVCQPNRPLFPR